MDEEKTLVEKLAQTFLQAKPKVEQIHSMGRAGVELLSDGSVYYLCDHRRIRAFHSFARTTDDRVIHTKTAKKVKIHHETLSSGLKVTTHHRENGLLLRRELMLHTDGSLVVQLFLEGENGVPVESRCLAPLDMPYPDDTGEGLFLSLEQKMLLVPYDNDMWARYESAPPRPGRVSYDVTAIYDPRSLSGLVLGTLDHDVWKNGFRWSAHDARALVGFSGIADGGTHDCQPHGAVSGKTVSSDRFYMAWSGDIRRGLEQFAAGCGPCRPWNGKAIFGWNSYAALGLGLKLSHWQTAGDFIHRELPLFRDEGGVSFINLDGAFGLNRKEIRSTVEQLHARGQKAGWYASPCNIIGPLGLLPIPGTKVPLNRLVLKDHNGRPLPPADSSTPLDVTHPMWEVYCRRTLRGLLELGIDYLKLDFLSHAGVEGAHYRREFTGRMALNLAYSIILDELQKADREIFVSLSISPLFPSYLGHARRICCDSFGHREDTRYVLNALTYGWWAAEGLYRYNDPDHLVLQHSVIDKRDATSPAEARSRYLSGVICGMLILSENYGPQGDHRAARERTISLTSNPAVQEVASFGRSFAPVELGGDASAFYTLRQEGRLFLAAFELEGRDQRLAVPLERAGLPEKGRIRSLFDGSEQLYDGELSIALQKDDCGLYELFPE